MIDEGEAWSGRLRDARNLVVTLTRAMHGQRLDRDASPTGVPAVLPAGTHVRYVETRYDPMRLDQAVQIVKVVAGPAEGQWVGFDDTVGQGPLPWDPAIPDGS